MLGLECHRQLGKTPARISLVFLYPGRLEQAPGTPEPKAVISMPSPSR